MLTVLGMKNISTLSQKDWSKEQRIFLTNCELQIALGIKSKKKTAKAISVIKKDRQAFGVILGNKIDLSEAFKYQISSIPLSIRNPDGRLLQSLKNTFRNFLIDESSAIETQLPFQACWIIDTMTIMRSVK